MAMTNKKAREQRHEHCANTYAFVAELCADADLRGVSHKDVASSIAVALTAENPTLAGEILARCKNALLTIPVSKVVEAPKPALLGPDGNKVN